MTSAMLVGVCVDVYVRVGSSELILVIFLLNFTVPSSSFELFIPSFLETLLESHAVMLQVNK